MINVSSLDMNLIKVAALGDSARKLSVPSSPRSPADQFASSESDNNQRPAKTNADESVNLRYEIPGDRDETASQGNSVQAPQAMCREQTEMAQVEWG